MPADAERTAAAPPPVRVDCHGTSHVGQVRERNEDHFAVMTLQHQARLLHSNLDDAALLDRLTRPAAQVLVVADGVGGVAGGEEASGLAVGTVVEYLAEAASCWRGLEGEREHAFIEALTGGVERAHQRIVGRYGAKHAPATTLTMVTLLWPRAYVVHVGDSRGYLLRRGRLRRFTADQTMGDFFVDIGRVTAEHAAKAGLFDVLSSAVGSDMLPSVGVLDLEPGDALLLCTDGLTKHVPDDRVAALLGEAPDAATACERLVAAALADGGRDNVTVVVARA